MSVPKFQLPDLPRLDDYPAHYAAERPNADALIFEQQRLTYADFERQVMACARALLAAGIGHGDRIAMLSTPRPEVQTVFLAAVRIGAIWIGLNPRHRLRELRYVLDDAEPALLVSLTDFEERDYRPDIASLTEQCPCIRRVVTFGGSAPGTATDLEDFLTLATRVDEKVVARAHEAVQTDDPAVIIYTSGTTGQPKGAILSHHSLITSYLIQNEHWPTDPLRAISCLPINHIGGIGTITTYAMVAGGTVVLQERFDPRRMLEALDRERITFLLLGPTMYQLLLEQPDFEERDLSSLRWVNWSGAAAPRDLVLRLKKIGGSLGNNYGLTESGDGFTYTDPDASLEVMLETVGRPDPRFEVKLADPEGVPVTRGEAGEICFRHSIMMLGYWRRPEETAAAIDAEGWLHTGDLALERPDGNFELVGRLKEMFKSGGYNIYPREVEGVIESHPSVSMAVVVSVPDPLYNEVGHAFVLVEPGYEVDAAALQIHCRENLANYKVPKRFAVRSELPMLPIGKVDRQALKREAAAGV